MVGADSCCVTIQPPVWPELGNVHHELLFGAVMMLENMDLRELARDRVYEFLYLNLTERIRGATGSPVRPLALRCASGVTWFPRLASVAVSQLTGKAGPASSAATPAACTVRFGA